MSILAEPRYKRKICVDPQNLKWKNDSSKFGQKMMEKMGWSEGKGLGMNEQGRTENLKLKANWTQKGLKAESEKQNSDKTWMNHHDEFSFLLEKLNKKKETTVDEESEEPEIKKPKNAKSIEETVKSKNKFFYRRIRMKDLSRYSEKDKSAVIGIRKKEKIEKEDNEVKEPTPEMDNPQVKKSELSVNDYFAQKMAKFYAKKETDGSNSALDESTALEKELDPESSEPDFGENKKHLRAEKKAQKIAKFYAKKEKDEWNPPLDEPNPSEKELDSDFERNKKMKKKQKHTKKEKDEWNPPEKELDPDFERNKKSRKIQKSKN